jgi:glyoxylase-like metal-dependent hydrolase (beta-lactamase superfamily II)
MDVARVPVPVGSRTHHGATNCYVVGGERALLIDPPGRSEDLDDALAGRGVSHVAATHHHPDHVGAVAHHARARDATVWCRYGREAAFESATGIEADRTFREGTTIPCGDGDVAVVETPGHAPEHVSFAAGGDLVSGDLAVAEGSVVVGAPEGDVRAYLGSLRRVRSRDPERLRPGHGPAIEDPGATCERLIEHRRDRERRVLAAVRAGATTLEGITDAAYGKDVSAVRGMAVATVEAHLEKLAVEGRVSWDGAHARLP